MLPRLRSMLLFASVCLPLVSCGTLSTDQPPPDGGGGELGQADAGPPPAPAIGSIVTLATFSQSKTWRAGTYAGPWGVAEDGFADPAIPVPFVAPGPLRLYGFYARVRVPDVAGPHSLALWSEPAGGPVFAARFPLVLPAGKAAAADDSDMLTMARGDAVVFRNDADLYGGAIITAKIQLLGTQ